MEPPMNYIAIATFVRETMTTKEIMTRRRNYTYPSSFKNVQSYVDVQGGTSRDLFRNGLRGVHPEVHRGLARARVRDFPGCSFGPGLGDLPATGALRGLGELRNWLKRQQHIASGCLRPGDRKQVGVKESSR